MNQPLLDLYHRHVGAVFDRQMRFADFLDGLSNTAIMAEIVQGSGIDIRGLMWSSLAGAGSYSSRFAPNQFKDYYQLMVPTLKPPIPPGSIANADIMPNGFCNPEPVIGLPCLNVKTFAYAFAGARSRHAGVTRAQPRGVKDHINLLRPFDLKQFGDWMPSLGRRLPVNLVVSVPGYVLAEPFKFAPLADLPVRVDAEGTAIKKQRRKILPLG